MEKKLIEAGMLALGYIVARDGVNQVAITLALTLKEAGVTSGYVDHIVELHTKSTGGASDGSKESTR